MSEQAGEKTEQATPKRLEEALRKGQFARSPEVRTAFVLAAGLIALRMSGSEIWGRLALAFTGISDSTTGGTSGISTIAHIAANPSRTRIGMPCAAVTGNSTAYAPNRTKTMNQVVMSQNISEPFLASSRSA